MARDALQPKCEVMGNAHVEPGLFLVRFSFSCDTFTAKDQESDNTQSAEESGSRRTYPGAAGGAKPINAESPQLGQCVIPQPTSQGAPLPPFVLMPGSLITFHIKTPIP